MISLNIMTDDALIENLRTIIESRDSEILGQLREDLDLVQRQYAQLKAEDQGWLSIFGGQAEEDLGLELETLKDVSRRLKQSMAGSPLPKQANALRYSYTFSQPFIIPELTAPTEIRAGRPSKKRAFYSNPVNQKYVFGKEAQELISGACSTDGCYLAMGSKSSGTIRPIPLYEVVGYMVNPEFPEEIWAYHRQWKVGKETQNRWYYTDRFEGTRQKSMGSSVTGSQDRVAVDGDKTIIDLVVNRQVGWSLGVPDLMAGEVWNRKFITMMNHGEEVSATLAFYAAKVRTKSKAGSDSVGVKIGGNGGAGRTVTHGEGNEVDVFSSAGRVYDFDSLRPVAAMYATSTGVSVVDLLASPAAAGSSYGSASALAPGMRRGIESRRNQIAGWMERVFKWAVDEDIKIAPASIEEVEPYRRSQIVTLAHNSGLFHEDEIRPEMAALAGITLRHTSAPDGYLIPNNEDSLPRKDIDADSSAPTATAASPTQGRSSGDGGTGSTDSNDQRTDTIS